jgi:hypothetical protein
MNKKLDRTLFYFYLIILLIFCFIFGYRVASCWAASEPGLWQDYQIKLYNGETLYYRASNLVDTCAGFPAGTSVDNCYLVFTLYPSGEVTKVHYCMIESAVGQPLCKNANGEAVKDIYANGKWFSTRPLVFVTGYPCPLSIIGYPLEQPLPSNFLPGCATPTNLSIQ